jgi:hypothetical protein
MSLAAIPIERLPAAVDRREPADAAAEARPVIAGGQLAGLLVALERGWRFRSLRRRFDALNGGTYCRAEDALCAARGIVALESAGACVCARRSDALHRTLLGALDTMLEPDAA